MGGGVILRAKQTGEYLGILPAGKQVEYEAILWYRLADGKIQEAWTD